MLEPEEIEVKLLSAIDDPSDMGKLREIGINSESFLMYGEVFDYFTEYLISYSELPRPYDVAARFNKMEPPFELEEKTGSLEYYADELSKLSLGRKLRKLIRESIGDHAVRITDNPIEVVRLLGKGLTSMQHQRSRNISLLDQDALLRFDALEERIAATQEGRLIGIPTGFSCFDDLQDGWRPGEAIMLIAPKGLGKSWVMMLWATLAYKAGLKVLFFTPEMAWEECALRFDVLLARQYHKEFSHTKLTTGTLVDLDEYRDWLLSLTERSDFICVDALEARGFSLAGMLSMIEQYNPDIVFMDGLHLVPGDDARWENIKEAADGLKANAQKNKTVVIWASQVDREGMRNAAEPVSSGASAAYSKGAVEAANRLITLGGDKDDPMHRVFKVTNNRSGREYNIKQTLRFDVDIGEIRQVDPLEVEGFGKLIGGGEI